MGVQSCGVISIGTSEALGRDVFEDLRDKISARMSVLWQPAESDRAECDLIVVPVGADNFEASASAITDLRNSIPACGIIVVCSELRSSQIAALLASGAVDFVSTPYSGHELATRVQRAAGLLPPRKPDETGTVRIAREHGLIGTSPSFLKQVSMLPVIAGCDASALILGETGVGKEVFARAIHYLSPRASRPLVAVNCGAIPTELMESELFGCVRGAFTSAHTARSGLVKEAQGGTLFLDEIDALSLNAQTKLLRFLQEKEYRPVGDAALCHADVRVIAASNHDLAVLTECNAFRRDLYFRLNVLMMTLPTLRDRREDIPLLAVHFAEQCCRKQQRLPVSLTAQAIRKLRTYAWPGNIRELHNVVERAVLFCHGSVIGADDLDLPDGLVVDESVESFRVAKARMVEAFERSYIERLLMVSAGNITLAASAARKNRRAFFALMRKYSIEPARFRGSNEILR